MSAKKQGNGLRNSISEELFDMRRTETKTQKLITDTIVMIIGAFLLALGVYFFEMPNHFSSGGITGVSIILGKFLPISTATILVILNVLLLIIGFIFIGKDTGVKTVFCSLMFSGFTWLLERFVSMPTTLTDQPLLELCYSVLLTGIASAILFYRNASSGGSEIIALIIKKYSKMNDGTALLCADILIAASSFFIFGIRIGLFSLLGLFAKAFLIDGVIESLNVCKSFMIITSNPEPIVDYVLNVIDRAATSFDAIGEYTGKDKKVIMVICRRPEANKLKQKVHEFDKDAFITVQSTSEIIGRGFRMR